jgi:hypothetical protein
MNGVCNHLAQGHVESHSRPRSETRQSRLLNRTTTRILVERGDVVTQGSRAMVRRPKVKRLRAIPKFSYAPLAAFNQEKRRFGILVIQGAFR